MLVHKCDNCKKEIKGRDREIIAGFAWPQFSFLRTLRKANYRVPGKMEPWLQGSRICYSRSLARIKRRVLDSLRFTVVSRLISSAIRFPIHLLVLVQAATTV